MNTIAVGIWAENGIDDNALQVYARVLADSNVDYIFVLANALTPFMARGTKQFVLKMTGIREDQETLDPAFRNRHGLARDKILQKLAADRRFDIMVILDGFCVPQPGYFEFLKTADFGNARLVMTGKNINHDGERASDICTVDILDNHIAVPYDDWRNPLFTNDLYAYRSQHIFNRAALDLNPRYPDVTFLEDYKFCQQFKRNRGVVRFLPEISAKFSRPRKAPDLYQGAWPSRDF